MSTRLEVVVDQLEPQPADRVVEIGCGHGVAATLVLERLTTGTYTGIDRSQKMIAAAARRNAPAVAAGRATFVERSVEDAGAVGGGPFDRLFAARVAPLATAAGMTAAHRLLAAGGLVLLAFDAPAPARAVAAATAATHVARGAGFTDVRRTETPFDGGVVVIVRAIRA
jgi:ubiquinone/menaquinone biosynthesis C-methylase UbiE